MLANPSCPCGVISCRPGISKAPLGLSEEPSVFRARNRKLCLGTLRALVGRELLFCWRVHVARLVQRGLCRGLGGQDPKGGSHPAPPENEGAHGAG